jgi:hypothetical protein
VAIRGNQWQSVALACSAAARRTIRGNQRQSEAIRGNHWKSEAISGNQWHSPVRRPLGAPPRAERTGAARARSRTCHNRQSRWQSSAITGAAELDLVPQSEAITMAIKRHPMARSEAIRSGALEITMAINLARSRSRAHPSKSRTICAATESCASVSTCGRGGRRSEHLHVGTHVRVGEHPKQIGLAQPLARAAP